MSKSNKEQFNLNIKLKKFDMKKIPDDSTVVIIGKRNTGKSVLTKDFLYYHKHIPTGTIISPTEKYNKFYSNIVPKMFIHNKFSLQLIKNVQSRQDKILQRSENDPRVNPNAFLVMDDCQAYKDLWVRNLTIKEFFLNGRHLKLLLLITLQDSMGITPELRTNTDFVFILRENRINMRKRIYDNYTSMFPTFEIFCKVMDQCTQNYECLVVDNSCIKNSIEEQVFWYKADVRNDFKIGSPELWQYSKTFEDQVNLEENDESSIEAYKNRKGTNVILNKVQTNTYPRRLQQHQSNYSKGMSKSKSSQYYH